jgi:hypothetical protein
MVHTAVVLPRNLLDRLRSDAERSGQGLSTEIRQRLTMACFGEAARDRETTEFIDFIQLLADSLARDVGKWHESENAKAAFVAGLLEFLRPEGVGGFKSFAEQYVLARAPTFERGSEGKDAFNAMLDAERVYKRITQQARSLDRREQAPQTPSPETDLEAAMRDMPQHSRDPDAVGRTHARLVMAARRETQAAEEERKSE